MVSTQFDDFLDHRLTLEQPTTGYRAGTDAVLLAAFVQAIATDVVVDLGCGVGTVSLCLSYRVGCQTIGIENNPFFHHLALSNAKHTQLPFTPLLADVCDSLSFVPPESADHVACNPPYYAQNTGVYPKNPLKAAAHYESGATLLDFVCVAASLLKPSGSFYLIQRADRMQDCLLALSATHLFPTALKCIYGLPDSPATTILLMAQKNKKKPLKILQPLVLYGEDGLPSVSADAVLRLGTSLSL